MTAAKTISSTSDAPLTLTTLGGANFARGNEVVLGPGKPLALVAYLALTPGHSASREFLVDLLWADLDRDRGRHALRQTLWQLRQELGESFFTGREELALGLAIDTDRDRFLTAIEGGDPERAIPLYRGQFLPDFALPGSTEFEHWAEIERSGLRATFLRAAEMVVRRRLTSGRFREAHELARRMRDADRASETAWRLILESLIASRDLLQATVEADALREVLATDDREAEPATKALLAELRKAQGEATAQGDGADPGLVAELFGREREFAQLLENWGAASRGPARHVHISAAAGLGKTRLLTDLGHRLRSLGAPVVYIRANPGDRTVAYAFAGDLAHALGPLPGLAAISPAAVDALVGLSPSLSARFPNAKALRHSSELLRLRTAALTEAATEVSAERPTALLVDDVHWLDPESHQVIESILHRLDRAPVLVVTAGRPGVARPLEVAGTTRLELKPLDRPAVHAFVASLGRLTDRALLDGLVERLHRTTGGSPLLLLESLQLAIELGQLRLQDGAWSAPDPAALLVALDQGSTFGARLLQLDRESVSVLLLLATAGTPLTPKELQLGTQAPERLEELLWLLERKGLVHKVGASWEPAHEEIAAAALDVETAERRQAAHGVMGRILFESAPGRMDAALQACRHFADARDEHLLNSAYRRVVRLARQAGDPRSHQALAVAAVGQGGPSANVSRLVRSLPLRSRLGLDSRLRLLAAGAVGLVVLTAVTAALLEWPATQPDARLLLLRHPGTDSPVTETTAIAIRRGSWRTGEPIRVAGRWSTIRDAALAKANRLTVGPAGRWAFSAFVDNVLTDDIFIRDGERTRLLVSADRDDVSPDWSPDGKSLFFVSAQWSEKGADDYDVAMVKISTGDVRRLTATPDFDLGAFPAPHGALVAFTRAYRDLRPREACWITRDGRASRCVESSLGEVSEVVGWLDGHRVLLRVMHDGRDRLVQWDLLTNDFSLFFRGSVSATVVSRDGRWVVCSCSPDPDGTRTWLVFPSNDPDAARQLDSVPGLRIVAWETVGNIRALPTLVRVIQRSFELPVGQAHIADVRVVDGQGDPLLLPRGVFLWTSRDTSVATVDSASGKIIGQRVGRVMIEVSFADVASDSAEVIVTVDSPTLRLREDWRQIDSTRWIEFGVPAPRIDSGPGKVRGLNKAGDGSYRSGVASTEQFDPTIRSRGQRSSLVADLAVSMAATANRVFLRASTDSRGLGPKDWLTPANSGGEPRVLRILLSGRGGAHPAGSGLF